MTDNERKKIISELRQLLAMCKFVDQYGDCIDADPYFNAVETAIESLNETRWIPVNEKLPEKSGWYLITTYGYEHVVDMFWYYHESNQWNGLPDLEKVVAWMPLPTPYERNSKSGSKKIQK